jgi:putative PIN family toxin of toxin-antitoxin system
VKIILDTNCFISSIGKKSPYRKVFNAFLNEQYILCLSTEILLEYEEKFSDFWGIEVSQNLMGTLLTANNISLHSIFYNFSLVKGDTDDNKFSDCYIAANADILVSNDTHLLSLAQNEFPRINVMGLSDFMKSLVA